MATGTQAPTGPNVTLVCTGIDGLTVLRETYGSKLESCLELHNAIIREEIEGHNGYEVPAVGDGFMIAFHSVIEAVRFCMAAQSNLHQALWPDDLTSSKPSSPAPRPTVNRAGLLVRMAVHTGDPFVQVDPLTEGIDYVGPTVNRATRLCAAAHGGQVLLSSTSMKLTLEELEENSLLLNSLTDLGHHALRRLSAPERLWQLLPPDLADTGFLFPAPRTPQHDRHNLPAPLTSFVGRETELQQLGRWQEQGERLITLLGGAGAGKTRLAIHYGHLKKNNLAGGIWIADLTNARTTNDVCSAVAKALDLPLTTRNAVAQVGETIASKGDVMLILDNFEQVVAAASETVALWLKLAPQARFLVTSRQVLWIRGEHLLAVDPLPIPPDAPPLLSPKSRLNEVIKYDAVTLFCVRAKEADPNFKLDADNASQIAIIVRCLDGIPIAIELAAARVRLLHPKQLVQRIQHRLEALRGPRNTGADRQATLYGAIDWSWRALPPWEQAALCRCSVFRGGFTLKACQRLVDLSAWPDAPEPTEVVRTLHEKSFLFRMQCDDDTMVRFSMCRSIQRYAESKLKTRGSIPGEAGRRLSGPEAHASALRAYGDYFAELGKAALALREAGQMYGLTPDLENLIKGANHGAKEQLASISSSCGQAAIKLLLLQGPCSAIVDLTDALLRVEDLTIRERMRVLNARGEALRIIGNSTSAHASFEQALDLAYRQKDHGFEASVRINLSVLSRQIGRMDGARIHAEKALELTLSSGDRAQATRILGTLGRHHHARGEVETGQEYFEQAKRLLSEIQEPLLLAITTLNTAEFDHIQGRVEQAEAAYHKADAIFEQQGAGTHRCITQILLARLRADTAAHGSARELFDAALTRSRTLGNRRFEGLARTGLAGISIRTNRIAEAAEWIATALPILEEVGDPAAEGTAWGLQAEVQSIQRQNAHAASSIAHGEALLRDVGHQHQLGILLCGRARINLRNGGKALASQAVHEAALIAEQLNLQPRAPLQQHIRSVRTRLGEVSSGLR